MRSVFVFVALFSICSTACGTVLYQGSGSTTPVDAGYLLYSGGSNTTNVSASGITTLDTTGDDADQSGWGKNILNGSFPVMNEAGNGYVVSLDMKVLSQTSTSNDRAGISLIALSSDKLGVELAFYEDEVWVYDSSGSVFTHGVGATFDTTAAMTTYDLAIHGSTYEVFADGNSLFTGNLHDYSARGSVYNIANFIFLGDDTTESSGSFQVARLEINNATPEPGMIGFAALGLLALRRRR